MCAVISRESGGSTVDYLELESFPEEQRETVNSAVVAAGIAIESGGDSQLQRSWASANSISYDPNQVQSGLNSVSLDPNSPIGSSITLGPSTFGQSAFETLEEVAETTVHEVGHGTLRGLEMSRQLKSLEGQLRIQQQFGEMSTATLASYRNISARLENRVETNAIELLQRQGYIGNSYEGIPYLRALERIPESFDPLSLQ